LRLAGIWIGIGVGVALGAALLPLGGGVELLGEHRFLLGGQFGLDGGAGFGQKLANSAGAVARVHVLGLLGKLAHLGGHGIDDGINLSLLLGRKAQFAGDLLHSLNQSAAAGFVGTRAGGGVLAALAGAGKCQRGEKRCKE